MTQDTRPYSAQEPRIVSVHNSHLLKQLESRLSKLRPERDVLRRALTEAEQAHQAACERVRAVEREISELKTSSAEPVITEHALLRYLERDHGIDLEQIKSEMLTPAVAEQIRALKSCRLPIGNGTSLVVKGHVVQTVETAELRAKPAKQHIHRPRAAEARRLQAEEDGFV